MPLCARVGRRSLEMGADHRTGVVALEWLIVRQRLPGHDGKVMEFRVYEETAYHFLVGCTFFMAPYCTRVFNISSASCLPP
jgi:hypothetical protein